MATAGDRFDMPDGSAYIVVRPAAESGGEKVEMEFVLPPGCVPPPPHVHPRQVEAYEVIEGSFEVTVDSGWQTLGPGESASVPVGALDPRLFMCLSMVMLDFPETLVPGRRRDRIPMRALAGAGRLLALP